ncbi:GNAT family N-acetyltransferase (plasmid) [Mammaliicoccus lentus]|uniref:GNAT family N-acetyltransferase n=1 Tax=Mammaliicoccus lentus TaxID=42858 RepID=A0AAX3W8E1_MAMLE|nr:GNAT family N-acetyltransferase [Mammaliicoccus lentus]WHI61593.1 GNAT family N-acetyltransferase [Mammaliicoccus lentus]
MERFLTDRLILEERTMNDLDESLNLDKDPEVVKYIPEVFNIINDETKHREFVKNRIETNYPKDFGYWSIRLQETNEFLGWIFLIPETTNEFEIGWRLKRESWGKGYASEAANTIVKYALSNLRVNQIFAEIIVDNIASIKLAQKLGFKKDLELENGNVVKYVLSN